HHLVKTADQIDGRHLRTEGLSDEQAAVLVQGHPVCAEEPTGSNELSPSPSCRDHRRPVGQVALPARDSCIALDHCGSPRSVRVTLLERRGQPLDGAWITIIVHTRLALEFEGGMSDA